jgi:hypothetical protein
MTQSFALLCQSFVVLEREGADKQCFSDLGFRVYGIFNLMVALVF